MLIIIYTALMAIFPMIVYPLTCAEFINLKDIQSNNSLVCTINKNDAACTNIIIDCLLGEINKNQDDEKKSKIYQGLCDDLAYAALRADVKEDYLMAIINQYSAIISKYGSLQQIKPYSLQIQNQKYYTRIQQSIVVASIILNSLNLFKVIIEKTDHLLFYNFEPFTEKKARLVKLTRPSKNILFYALKKTQEDLRTNQPNRTFFIELLSRYSPTYETKFINYDLLKKTIMDCSYNIVEMLLTTLTKTEEILNGFKPTIGDDMSNFIDQKTPMLNIAFNKLEELKKDTTGNQNNITNMNNIIKIIELLICNNRLKIDKIVKKGISYSIRAQQCGLEDLTKKIRAREESAKKAAEEEDLYIEKLAQQHVSDLLNKFRIPHTPPVATVDSQKVSQIFKQASLKAHPDKKPSQTEIAIYINLKNNYDDIKTAITEKKPISQKLMNKFLTEAEALNVAPDNVTALRKVWPK